MYHLIIAAYPETAAVIMVGQETEEVDAAEVYRDYAFLPQLIPAIEQALGEFGKGDIKIYSIAKIIEQGSDATWN